MAPPLTPPTPGVAVVQVLAPSSLQPPQIPVRRAHIAIYTGMNISELARVLHSVLKLPMHVECTGFLVVDAHSVNHHHHHHHRTTKSKSKTTKLQRNGGSSDTYQRIVPLSLACAAPDLLATPSGYVTALVTHTEAMDDKKVCNATASAQLRARTQRSPCASPLANGAVESTDNDPAADGDAASRIARFVAAVCDDQALGKFEAAVLAELCEQQPARVLREMRSRQSVAHKRQFLLDLVRAGESTAAAASSTLSPKSNTLNGSAAATVSAQVALVHNKLVAIARTGCSPQMQSDVLAAAAAYKTERALAAPPSDASLSATLELLGVIERLLLKHALPEQQAAYVVRLVLRENRLLLSVLQAHRRDASSSAELEKAVAQIAALGGTNSTSETKANGHIKSPRRRTSPRKTPTASPRKSLRSVGARPIELLHSLHQRALLTSLEFDILGALIKQHDAQVLAAIDMFEYSRDVAALRDALVSVVAEITDELGDDERKQLSQQQRDPQPTTQSNGADGDDANDGHTSDWPRRLMQFVQHWHDRAELTAEHVAVLARLADAQHELLQSAWDVYVRDTDALELLDTLQRIAKLQLQVDDSAALQHFSNIVDAYCDVLRADEKALVKQLFVRHDELVHAAWAAFGAERDAHDLGDTLLRIARFSRRTDAKVRLASVVGEMLQRGLLRSHEADGLLQLYEQRHDALLAAAEAFESDGDVHELVETLLLVVKHAGFGDAPACSSPRHAQPTSPSLSIDRFDADDTPADTQLLEALSAAAAFADWQRELLRALVTQRDDRLLAALDVLRDDRDARECVDTLERLCDVVVWEQHGRDVEAVWAAPLERAGAVPPGVLSQLIAARDDRVFAALVVFLDDGDGGEFADSLQRIAQLANAVGGADATDDTESVDRVWLDAALTSLVQDGLLASDARQVVGALLDTSHPQALAAADVFAATGDRADFADTLERIVRREATAGAPSASSRIARMEKQLLHLASELALAPAQLAALKRSIARQDEILAAAVEVFEVEQDEEDLKDTLRRVAHHVVSADQ